MIHSKGKGLKALSILDMVEEGKPYTFIVFAHGERDYWFLKWLKRGFGHCYVIHFDGYSWIKIEKAFGFMKVENIFVLDGFYVGLMNIRRYYDAMGFVTVEAELTNRSDKLRVRNLFALATCVEMVKDFLGLSGSFVFTPYQLYKHLKKRG